MADSEKFLSKGKGESYDEICLFCTDHMVLGLCNNRDVFYGIGSICTLTTGLGLICRLSVNDFNMRWVLQYCYCQNG